MTPWTFALYQVMLSALPYAAILALLVFLGIIPPPVPDQCYATPDQPLRPIIYQHALQMFRYVRHLGPPIALLIFSLTAAYAALLPGEYQARRLRAAQHTFLYASAAYSLWSETAVVTLFGLRDLARYPTSDVPFVVASLLLVAAIVYQVHVTNVRTARRVIAAVTPAPIPDASPVIARRERKRRWRRYTLALWMTVPFGWFLIDDVLFEMTWLLGRYVAETQNWVRSLIQ